MAILMRPLADLMPALQSDELVFAGGFIPKRAQGALLGFRGH